MVAAEVSARRKRTLILVALGALGVLLPTAALLVGFGANEGTVLGQADWPWGRFAYKTTPTAPRLLVIRSHQDLVQASGIVFDGKGRQGWKEYLKKAFGVEQVNFDRRMLVVVVDGTHAGGSYRVEITKVVPDKEHHTLRVYGKLHAPRPGTAVPQQPKYPKYPATVVLLRRFEGPVELEPLDLTDPQAGEPKNP